MAKVTLSPGFYLKEHNNSGGIAVHVERGSIFIDLRVKKVGKTRWMVARLSLRCDKPTVERCAPIVHINQKYPIYNYCRSRLIYIYTRRDNNTQPESRQVAISNRLLNCVMTVTDESDIYIRLGVVRMGLKIRAAPELHLLSLINNL